MKLDYLIGALLLCVTQIASAAIYTYIDANGERVYTDKPPQHQRVETVNIAPTNQLPAVPVQATIKPPPVYQDDTTNPTFQYQVLRILTPEPNATIRANDRRLIVMISSEPALLDGHLYRLLLDGEPVAEPSRSPVFPLSQIERGTHKLAVEIINQQGAVLERTPAQPFHFRQTTLNDKRRVRPCELDDYGVRPECPVKDKPEKKSSIFPF
ncbi:DUF4124 domain-containing protein [Pseudomonas sp. C27(2019)]|uniref:DUF4124 domain-containing protein n=1 Tax=Pseudomonas sp. C27(2019) TaxID=2604941 RepID=UPI0012475418|nr:DUF4124 domain-containing protein [Pseudomonas sp. C27(2019)]QEY59702.1 DUF4124 domain-containing protein [Pseudomonas sp. C27(2019)]